MIQDDSPAIQPDVPADELAASRAWRSKLSIDPALLASHSVHGRALLPGLAWIDSLYRCFAERGHRPVSLVLKNLVIHRPLSVSDSAPVAVLVEATCAAGIWKVGVRTDVTDGRETPYVTAEMHSVAAPPCEGSVDLANILRECRERTSLDRVYEKCRERGLLHTGIMAATGTIYSTEDVTWIHVNLARDAANQRDPALFHPALIDASAIAASSAIEQRVAGEQRLYLPLFYESFRASGSFGGECFTRIPHQTIQAAGELVSLSMEFYSPAGVKMGELINLKSKCVRDPASINPLLGTAPTESVKPAPATASFMPGTSLAAFLQGLFASKLGLQPRQIALDQGYYEMGLTSSMLLEVVGLIEAALALSLPPTLLFEHTTIATLAAHLSKEGGVATVHSARARESSAAHSKIEPRRSGTRTARTTHSRLPVHTQLHAERGDLAVIGLAGRYPRARNIQEFWENLQQGRDCVTEVPPSRWRHESCAQVSSPSGKPVSKWGGFIDDVDCFDPQFFRMSVREAEAVDPQERLFLEVCWEAMEDAGYTPDNLAGPGSESSARAVGVFVGVMHKDYGFIQHDVARAGQPVPLSLSYAPIPNRVSYFCNFHGPSIAVDTVCSASLTAVHLARQSILDGECEVALAGGVNLSLHPNKYRTYGMMDMHSSDGRCRSFGRGGDGYVSGEGVGVIVLKPLVRAIADADHIYAVLKGSRINHGGAASGITVPSPVAQGELIADCLQKAGIDPQTLGYIEAHGTGTSLGDPIEVQGLSRAFRKSTDRKQFCALGSVKSNVGHAEAAAGISGLSKAILQLHHKTLVRSLHADVLNPHLDLAASPFYLQQVTEPWMLSSQVQVRRAGVSSFGATGSNAHVVLEESPLPARVVQDRVSGGVLLPLSALNPQRLRAYVERLVAFLQAHPQTDVHALAFTLQTGRVALKERCVVLVGSVAEATSRLCQWLDGKPGGANQWQGSVGTDSRRAKVFGGDEELQAAVGQWIANGQWHKLAELWVEGCAVDWRRLYGDQPPGRISAPTYPFAKERYWVDAVPAGPASANIGEEFAHAPRAQETSQRLSLFQEHWEEQPLRSVAAWPKARPTLVFANATLKEQIDSDDGFGFLREAILVCEAQQYRAVSSRQYACRSDSAADIETLLRAVTAEARTPVAIIHAWAMNRGEVGIQALFCLFKAIKPFAEHIAHITLLGNYDPARVETCWDYSWIGFERSLRLILPNVQLSILFCSPASCTPEQLQDAATRTGVIRYQGEKRLALSCVPTAERAATGEVPLRVNGQYLVTGGCGALGFKFAHYLASRYQAKLILAGRTPLSASIQEKLDALGEAGAAEVQYHAIDISNAAALTAWGRTLPVSLCGIIHAAGVESRQAFFEKTPAQIEQVLHPKTLGTLLLDEVFSQQPLDFVCYFSSSAAMLGDLGSCDYAIANRFQMAYGEHRRRYGNGNGQTIVINWPLWREGGMGQGGAEQAQFYLKSSGQEALESAAGIDSWLDILRRNLPQTLVLAGAPPRMEQLLQRIYRSEQISAASPAPAAATRSGWKAHRQGLSVQECIELDLKQLISINLKAPPDKLDLTTNLADYGFDSLSLSTFAKQLSEHFAQPFAPALFFSHATIAELVEYFLQTHGPHIQAFYRRPEAENDARCVAPIAISEQLQVTSSSFTAAASLAASARLPSAAANESEPIAVIGMSGRFPRASTVDEMWACLAAAGSAITEIPASRWNWRHYFTAPGDKSNLMSSNQGGFIDGIDEFDPLFFAVSPREAQDMDPSERLLLMEAYKAVEDAGLDPASLRGSRTGFFVGMEESQYSWLGGGQGITTGGNAMVSSRLSYYLDLHGPTIAINTACSSGLVALHQAVTSLRQDECEAALVASVALTLAPESYVMMSQAGMVSSDGQCFSFSNRANGIGIGEAAVVLMLMPLSAAIAAGHSIYGTIKASGVNFDGKTNGVTAPNGRMQAKLIEDIYDRHDIDARNITYLIAHGTGTKLGDAVELNALHGAFQKLLARRAHPPKQPAHCALTSCKSNFGHTMAASGLVSVAGLLKAIQHHTIPASLHCEDASDAIAWGDSPFYLNTKTLEWRKQGNRPHQGAVSSFGRSGTNAHVVLEECAQPVTADLPPDPNARHIVLLSARSAERLRQKARDLLSFLQAQPAPEIGSLAYTLQVGREAMEERLGFIVSSTAQLLTKLQSYVEAEQPHELRRIEGLFRGSVGSNAETLALFSTDADLQLTVAKWMADAKLSKLLDLWVKGLALDWNELHQGAVKPRRIRLPTYPFAAEKYWIAGADARREQRSTDRTAAVLHPLLHVNTSSLARQSYRTTLRGNEFFLTDHRVKGNKVLPGVAYLEMARAAVRDAVSVTEASTLTLRNVVWARPVVVTGPRQIGIALASGAGEHLHFEVHGDDAEQVHCEGQAALLPRLVPHTLDIGELERQMQRGRLEPGELYERFIGMGLEYGPAFRAVTSVALGEGQLLARLRLTAGSDADRSAYELHPGMMDGALQAALGLAEDLSRAAGEPLLPFALDELSLLSACTEEMLAWVRYSPGAQPGARVIKLDVDLCDTHGNVRVQMRGFSSRALSVETDSSILPPEPRTSGCLLATPVWKSTGPDAAEIESIDFERRYVFLCELPLVDASQLEQIIPASRCVAFHPATHLNIAERYTQCALACFEQLQAILRARPEGNVLVQAVMANQGEQALFAGLSGMLRTAALENPRIKGQVILCEAQVTTSKLSARLQEDRTRFSDVVVCYQRDERSALQWQPMIPSDEHVAHPTRLQVAFQNHGVYLITGGLGGLGRLFAQQILRQTTHAKVVLTGRSSLAAQQQAVLDELAAGSGRVEYRRLDLGELDQVRRLVAEIDRDAVRLRGILHCAGMTLDRLVVHKTAAEVGHVLAPKVRGTFHLDQASKDSDLDFLALFSSVSSVFGNPGQADYAAANGFLDQFAMYRNQLAAQKERRGLTLAINWPLWEAGGMSVDEAQRELLKQQTGMLPLQTATGVQAFQRCLELGVGQALVLEGDRPRLLQRLAKGRLVERADPQPASMRVNDGSIKEFTQRLLCKQFAQVLKLPADRIDPRAPLEKYGIDSILALELTNQLEQTFGSLSKTLLFEYQSVAGLAEHFIAAHRETLDRMRAGREEQVRFDDDRTRSKTVVSFPKQAGTRSSERRAEQACDAPPKVVPSIETEQIAIIGMSGRYPQALDLREYWHNLRDGKDCIGEVPRERWDWQEFFSDDGAGAHRGKWGGFIAGVDEFDAAFFDISSLEAQQIDPQERMFLQHAWMALEDAGYTRARLQIPHEPALPGQVGVYAGVMYSEYPLLGIDAGSAGDPVTVSGSYASIANRVSHALNLRGPSLTLDSMCSSSLSAIHLACQDLLQRRTDLAIAGGVNLSIHPHKYRVLSAGRMLSTRARCESFGTGGDGYIPGEGVGVIVLQRLSEAVADGSPIYGIIRGSALNHGGTTTGYGVPDPRAQADVISLALAQSRTDPRHVSYIEAHGTGTQLGDAIEMSALHRAFQQRPVEPKCPIGSAKSNIGHLEAAAGVAALSKVLLQIKYRQLVPSLHSATLNPHVNFVDGPFVVNQGLGRWHRPVIDGQEIPRIAGISCFGAGGTNAHLIVQEYIAPEALQASSLQAAERRALIVPLSARTTEQLRQKAADLLEYLQQHASAALEPAADTDIDLISLAYTLQVGREAMEQRAGFIVSSVGQLAETLAAFLQGELAENAFCASARESSQDIAMMLGDDDIQEAIDRWIARGKLPQLLALWCKGLELDWYKLYAADDPVQVRRGFLNLPAYPFARERHWLEARRSVVVGCATSIERQREPLAAASLLSDSSTRQSGATQKAHQLVRRLVAEHAQKRLDELEPSRSFQELGLNSLALVGLSRSIQQEVDLEFGLSALFEHGTIHALAAHLTQKYPAALASLAPSRKETPSSIAPVATAGPPDWSLSKLGAQFPELVNFNHSRQGRAVFWFHGGLGGVQSYHVFADAIERPFYGIQARGYQTDRPPLRGIQAMAAYYIQVLRAVQPEGPYDLGGYSMGGMIAYEVARQLQEQGQKTATIVMLDTLDRVASGASSKDDILFGVNSQLLPLVAHDLAKLKATLIHRREVDATLDEASLLECLIDMARERGLLQEKAELRAAVARTIEMIRAYEVDKFELLPLKAPEEITCYYFRNKSGLFLGELQSFYMLADAEEPKRYWEGWQRHIPQTHVMDVDSPSHAHFFLEAGVVASVAELCTVLYSESGSSADLNAVLGKYGDDGG